MPRTILENSIRQGRRTQGLVRPLLEELFKQSIRINDEIDVEFINNAAIKSSRREQQRQQNSVFSPSGLASCLRRVYLGRHWKDLGLQRIELPNIQTHGTFSNGDWVHLQWHFYMHKLDRMMPDKFMLVDIEVPVMSKRKDHGGTIDCIGYLIEHNLPVLIDYKGWNVRNWQSALNGLDHSTRIQVTDYMMLLNSSVGWQSMIPYEELEGIKALGIELPEKVKDACVFAINKGGPDPKHPLALHEIHVGLRDNLPDVRARLEVLRDHEEKEEIPEPECVSTQTAQYQGCPFALFCKDEVKAIERKRKAQSRDTKDTLKVARPTRDRSSGRPRPKRRRN